jgi:pimeloyl-ACP methyl ester carboxylesterase
MAQPSLDLCDQGELVFFEDSGHFVQHDEAHAVNEHLVEFFSSET